MDDGVARKNPTTVDSHETAVEPLECSPPDHMVGRVLRPAELLDHVRYAAAPPSEALQPWVERYWSVSWDLGPGESYRATTVSEPAINLTSEWGEVNRAGVSGPGLWVTGPVSRTHFDVGLAGWGGVIGVKFHLGGTRAFTSGRPADIRDATIRARRWFSGIEDDLEVGHELVTAAEVLDRWLLSFAPVSSDGCDLLRRALAVMADPAVTTVSELALLMSMSVRSLQRLFLEYCGVGVKQILARSRVIDAVAALDRGWDGTLGELAVQFGWFDQSHFTSDFLRTTGYRPAEYAARGRWVLTALPDSPIRIMKSDRRAGCPG